MNCASHSLTVHCAGGGSEEIAGPSSGAKTARQNEISEATETHHCKGRSLRTMTWLSDAHHHGSACSDCAWIFKPSGPPIGQSLDRRILALHSLPMMSVSFMRLAKLRYISSL